MNDTLYNAHVKQMRSHKLTLGDDDFNNILQQGTRYIKATKNVLEYSSHFDAKPLYIRTEGITKSPCCEANKILDIFGLNRIANDEDIFFRKAGMYSDDQIKNIDQLLSYPGISDAANLYTELVSALPYL